MKEPMLSPIWSFLVMWIYIGTLRLAIALAAPQCKRDPGRCTGMRAWLASQHTGWRANVGVMTTTLFVCAFVLSLATFVGPTAFKYRQWFYLLFAATVLVLVSLLVARRVRGRS